MYFIVSMDLKKAFALSAGRNLISTYPFPGIIILRATGKEPLTHRQTAKKPEQDFWRLSPPFTLGQSNRPVFSLRRRSCTCAQIPDLLSPMAVTLDGLKTTRQLVRSSSCRVVSFISLSHPASAISITPDKMKQIV
jgi:hypothetical protein